MQYDPGDPAELRQKFWRAMAQSPYVMLQLDRSADSAAPMTAQLDRDAHHAIWFFTTRDNHFAAGGPATATFAAKDHDVFARFTGTLSEETDRARRDKQWNSLSATWFEGGKDDPKLLMLRMDLGPAAIWAGEAGAINAMKMAQGMNVAGTIKGGYVETRI